MLCEYHVLDQSAFCAAEIGITLLNRLVSFKESPLQTVGH